MGKVPRTRSGLAEKGLNHGKEALLSGRKASAHANHCGAQLLKHRLKMPPELHLETVELDATARHQNCSAWGFRQGSSPRRCNQTLQTLPATQRLQEPRARNFLQHCRGCSITQPPEECPGMLPEAVPGSRSGSFAQAFHVRTAARAPTAPPPDAPTLPCPVVTASPPCLSWEEVPPSRPRCAAMASTDRRRARFFGLTLELHCEFRRVFLVHRLIGAVVSPLG